MDEPPQPGDLTQLRNDFPDWSIESRWTVAGTGPDSRYLLAHKDDVTITASAGDLAIEIRRETCAR